MTKKPQQDGRKTTLIVTVVLALLGAWNLFHRHRVTVGGALLIVAASLLIVGFLPSLARRFHNGWMALGAALGHVNSRVLLSVTYYLVITPFGAMMRIVGHDPLRRRNAGQESYWITRKVRQQSREQFERSY